MKTGPGNEKEFYISVVRCKMCHNFVVLRQAMNELGNWFSTYYLRLMVYIVTALLIGTRIAKKDLSFLIKRTI